MGNFVFTFLHGNVSFRHGSVSIFQDFYFAIMEFVLSVYIVPSAVVSILSLLPLILLSISLLFALVILLLLLSLQSHCFFFCLFYPYFNVIVVVSIFPNLIIEVEPCTICTLNDLVPCSIGIQSYMSFKTKFVQIKIVN